MINVSQTIKNSCKADKNTHTEYIVINGQTIYIKGKLNATAYKDTTFFGTFNMKVLEFETENTTQFRNRQFEYYKVIDGNAFKVGTFITTEVVDNDSKDSIKVTANDYALKFAVPYTSELDYSSGNITLYDVLEECCNQVGVELENKFIDNNNFKVDSNQFVNGELVGDVICAIAGISGNFATITNEDKLRLTFTNGTGAEQTTTIDGSTQINASGFKDIDLLGNTTQNTTTGKNLLNLGNISGTNNNVTYSVENGKLKLNGACSSDRVTINLPTQQALNGTYTFSTNYIKATALKKSGGTNLFLTTSSSGVKTETINDTITQLVIYGLTGVTFSNQVIELQVESGNSYTSWEPYTYGASPNPNYPQPIETTTGRNTIEVAGKNLFTTGNGTSSRIGVNAKYNGSEVVLNGTTTSAGNIFYDETISLNTGYRKSQKLPAGTYTISTKTTGSATYPSGVGIAIYIRDGSGTILKSFSSIANYQTTLTLSSETQIYSQMYINGSGGVYNNYSIHFQIEKGSATTYEPYIGNSYEVNLGKNLFDVNNTLKNKWINGQGDIINYTGSEIEKISCKGGETYTLSAKWATDDSINNGGIIVFYDSNNNMLSRNPTAVANNMVLTKTAPANSSYMYVGRYIATPTTIQLEVGSTASSYSPYFEPIELCKIGTYQDRLFKASGKNLANDENIKLGYTLGTSGEIISNNARTTLFQNEIKPSTTYNSSVSTNYLIGNLFFYDSNKNYLSQQTSSWGTTKTFTTPNNAYYISFATKRSDDGTMTQSDLNALHIQLEKGSSSSSYEPYGNYWYKYNAIGKYIFDGSTNAWGYSSTNSVFVSDIIASLVVKNTGLYSNFFKNISNSTTYANMTNGTIKYDGTNSGRLILKNTSYTSADDFKTWLGTHNTLVYYVLATPTYTKIENDELIGQLDSIKTLDLFDGINNITTNAPYFLTYIDGNVEVLEDYTDLDDKRDTQPITSVSIGTSQVEGQEAILRDENLIAQYGEHWLVINDNPFGYTLEKRQQLVKAIFDKVKGFGYSSFKSEYSYRPYLELGDKIKFKNKNGDLINSAILRYNFDFDNCTFEAPSITSATIDYELSPDANELAKRAEIIANQADASITAITQGLQIDEDGNSQVIESIKTTQKQNSLDIEAITSYEEIDGKQVLTGVKTKTGFTFNSQGLIIESSKNTYKAVHNETGDYYYDGDTPLGETTNEGSKFKNMDLYGEFRYGKDDIDDPALFVSMKYEDDNGEIGFGHFYSQ